MDAATLRDLAGSFPTIAATFRPSRPTAGRAYDVALVVLGSVLIALSARIVVPLPVSPVPVTGQTLAVLLLGVLLGARAGVITVTLYIVQGAVGLPVFAGGTAGIAHLIGPTGGYLVGFIAAAHVVGRLAERGWDRRAATTVLAMVVGSIAMYVPGVLWLSFFLGPALAMEVGLLPFLPGAALKIALATLLLPAGWRLLRWLRG